MKKILMAAAVALCFAGNSFAEEIPGGKSALDTALGKVTAPVAVATTAGVLVAAGLLSNNNGTALDGPGDPDGPDGPGDDCAAGEELVNGQCVPVSTSTTTTATTTATTTVTSTMTTPATVTATTTL